MTASARISRRTPNTDLWPKLMAAGLMDKQDRFAPAVLDL
jgi:hypothetical protein